MAEILFLIYRYLLLPLAVFILEKFTFLFPPKINEMIKDRKFSHLPALPARPIWIHASSGEIEYAKPVIRLIKDKWPQIPILVTYFSPSAKKLIKNIPGIDFSFPVPFDERARVADFLHRLNPLACLIARTDVWPEIATQLKVKKIPTLLFSATLSDDSSRKAWLSKLLTKIACDNLDTIYCVTERDLFNFQDIGVKTNLHVTGDTRYDQVFFRLENAKKLKDLSIENNFNFIAGSTWPQDEKILFPALVPFLRQGMKLILAPHEISEDRLISIEKFWLAHNLNIKRYTTAQDKNYDILLIDQIGILPELYTWGHCAFVGGSFKDRVHSVMEPLAAGLIVFVGPFHSNNREALHFQQVQIMNQISAVSVIHDTDDFTEKMQALVKNQHQLPLSELKKKVASLTGASQHVLTWLVPKIGHRPNQ